MVRYYCGLDLGQSNDFTALTVLEKVPGVDPVYHIRRLERVRDLDYPEIVSKVSRVMKSHELVGNATLIIDHTGVGRPIFDLFSRAGLNPVGISITGEDSVNHDGNQWRVPKRDLVSSLQVMFQNGKLKISNRLKLADSLESELLNFQMKISDSGHDSYAAKGSAHDDLVLSAALAAWYANRQSQNSPVNWSNIKGPSIVPGYSLESKGESMEEFYGLLSDDFEDY
jgi:hypothetical protein